MKSRLVLIGLALFTAFGVLGAERVDEAKTLFGQYESLGRAFDPAVAHLSADDAKIENLRTQADGSVKLLSLPAPAYKKMIRQVMPIAKERGDTSPFSEVKYAEEGENVRITATRFSELKKHSSPLSLLVGPSADGKWLIREERSESKP
jgi:hypothetical protein